MPSDIVKYLSTYLICHLFCINIKKQFQGQISANSFLDECYTDPPKPRAFRAEEQCALLGVNYLAPGLFFL